MFKNWIDKLSKHAKDEEDTIEFKSYEEEKESEEEIATLPDPVSEPVKEASGIEGGNIELKVVRPEAMDEVFSIADYLVSGCTVVLNLELLDGVTINRMLDFLNGVIYRTDGEVKNVSAGTYIITPTSDVNVNK